MDDDDFRPTIGEPPYRIVIDAGPVSYTHLDVYKRQAALCHCTQQTRRFQGDGFTTGVRAGDDERIVLFTQRLSLIHI